MRSLAALMLAVVLTLGATQCGQATAQPSAGVLVRSGAWWGDVNQPNVDQVWVDVTNATPTRNLTSPFTYRWTCRLPQPNSLRLIYSTFQVNSRDQQVTSNPSPGQALSYRLDPTSRAAEHVEIRIRCVARETVGPDTGQETGVTAGFPVKIRGGTGGDVWQHHNLGGYVDSHAWYSRGVEYDYAIADNAAALMASTASGIVPIQMHGFARFGDTRQDHHRLLVDGQIRAEYHGTTEARTIQLDTRTLSDGPHTLAVHSHALETSASEQPGKQLAGQTEFVVMVDN